MKEEKVIETSKNRIVVNHKESKYYIEGDDRQYSRPKKYNYATKTREPITLEEQVASIERKIKRNGIARFVKRKIAGNKVTDFISLADSKGIVLIEEDDGILIFGLTTTI